MKITSQKKHVQYQNIEMINFIYNFHRVQMFECLLNYFSIKKEFIVEMSMSMKIFILVLVEECMVPKFGTWSTNSYSRGVRASKMNLYLGNYLCVENGENYYNHLLLFNVYFYLFLASKILIWT